jgi:hypothetical protein
LSALDVINPLVMTNDPHGLTDDALIARIGALDASTRETTADLIAHLVELEDRNLHLACGFKSLYGYCRKVLHCTEAAAYDRMRTAHAARRFPVVLRLLASGAMDLTGVRLLSPYLRDEDHLALLGGALGRSTRDIRALLARWFPRPDVAASVRRLPNRRRTRVAPAAAPAPPTSSLAEPAPETPATSEPTGAKPVPVAPAETWGSPSANGPVAPSVIVPASRPTTAPPNRPVSTHPEPLAPSRYAFRFTGDEETAELLRAAQELLSHAIPNGDMAAIFKRGLRLLVAEAMKARYADTKRPGRAREIAADSRTIPAEVRRLVWDRDGGQCAFVGRHGHRCEERHFLEYHHVTPWIAGGPPTVANVQLRCQAHNQYEAKLYTAPIRRAIWEQ